LPRGPVSFVRNRRSQSPRFTAPPHPALEAAFRGKSYRCPRVSTVAFHRDRCGRETRVFGDLSKDKPAYVRAMFSAIALRYDLINTLLTLGRDAAWRRFVASQAAGPDGRVLDVATGTGELARQLARTNRRGTVVALDFCEPMLRKAGAKVKASSRAGPVEFVLGDALHLPFRDETFDSVTIGFALRNVSDILAAFSEITRVLRPGGRVVSLEIVRPSSRIARSLHGLVLRRMAPVVGGLISGSGEAYRYLPFSVEQAPSADEVKAVMEEAGLRAIAIRRLSLGMATVHMATKGG
jgi:demethylmenaquinone methyltransferase/2-methoxy-6-polyprenyl-1,4-benzoquinol methylase